MEVSKLVSLLATILVLVGALNWGVIALSGHNLVEMVLGSMPMVVRIVYLLVGLSALILLPTVKKMF